MNAIRLESEVDMIVEGRSEFFVTITRFDDSIAQSFYFVNNNKYADANKSDFILPSMVKFVSGQSQMKLKVEIINDAVRERPEFFDISVRDEDSILGGFSFSVIDDDLRKAPGNFGLGNDILSIAGVVSSESKVFTLDGGDGNDQAVLDFSGQSPVENNVAIFGDVLGPYGAPVKIVFFNDGPGSLTVGLNHLEALDVVGTNGDDLLDDWPHVRSIFGGEGNDEIRTADSDGKILIGGAGDDTIALWKPETSLSSIADGGIGFDEVQFFYGEATQNLRINMRTGQVNSGRWMGFERLYGRTGSGDDLVDASSHYIRFLDGGSGWDKLVLDYSGFMKDGRIVDRVENNFIYFADGTTLFQDIGNFEEVRFIGSDGGDRFNDQSAIRFTTFNLSGGGGDDRLIGGSRRDRLDGGEGNDFLAGGSMHDRLFGGSGDDQLRGGSGNDTLVGGEGRDVFTGGSGRDMFVFKSASDSGKDAKTSDRITDFSRAEGDRISLTGIDSNSTLDGVQAFTFIGSDNFSRNAGELRFSLKSNSTYISADFDGDGFSDFEIKVIGETIILEDVLII